MHNIHTRIYYTMRHRQCVPILYVYVYSTIYRFVSPNGSPLFGVDIGCRRRIIRSADKLHGIIISLLFVITITQKEKNRDNEKKALFRSAAVEWRITAENSETDLVPYRRSRTTPSCGWWRPVSTSIVMMTLW